MIMQISTKEKATSVPLDVRKSLLGQLDMASKPCVGLARQRPKHHKTASRTFRPALNPRNLPLASFKARSLGWLAGITSSAAGTSSSRAPLVRRAKSNFVRVYLELHV